MYRSPRQVAAAVVGIVLAVGLVVAPALAAGPASSKTTTRTAAATIVPTAGKGGGGTGGGGTTTTSPWTGSISVTPTNVGIGAVTPIAFKFKGIANPTTAAIFRITVPAGYANVQRDDSTAAGYVGDGTDCIRFRDLSTGSRSFRVDVTCSASASSGDISFLAKPAGSGSAKFVVANVTTATATQLASLAVNAVALRIALAIVPTTIGAGGTLTVTATVSDSKGTKYAGVPVAFTDNIEQSAVATPSAYTNTLGVATTTITPEIAATHRIGAGITGTNASASRNVTVTAGPLAAIALAGSTDDLVSGDVTTYTVTGEDQYGNTVAIAAEDAVAFEITADTDVVSVDTSSVDSAVVTGGLVGHVAIFATAGCTDCVTETLEFDVVAGAPFDVTAEMNRTGGTTGDLVTLTVQATDAAGNQVTLGGDWTAGIELTGASFVTTYPDATTASIALDMSGVAPFWDTVIVITVGQATGARYYDLQTVPSLQLSLDRVSGTTGDAVTMTIAGTDAYGQAVVFDAETSLSISVTDYPLQQQAAVPNGDATAATVVIGFDPAATVPATISFSVTLDGISGSIAYDLQAWTDPGAGTGGGEETLTSSKLHGRYAARRI